jgi:hypothetical protein
MKKPLFLSHFMTVSILAFGIMLSATASRTLAGEQRHHDAHVHGIARLNAAVEGADIHLEFTSPAANIVGFEHEPRTPEQKKRVKNAIHRLEDGSTLFSPSSEAQCRLSSSWVKTDIEHDAGHEADSDHEAEHAHKKDTHHEKDHGHEKDDHHGEGEDKDHEHYGESEDEHARHSEFEAQYRFACQHPEKLSQMGVMLIQAFPGIERIEVQLLTETKQTASKLTKNKSVIKF